MSLKGALILNNGYVDIDDIGEYSDALLCHTNKMDCCRTDTDKMTTKAGEWYFPDGSPLKIKKDNSHLTSYFFRDREFQVVRLNRVHSPSEYGKFYCIVPNATGRDQTIYVNIGMSINLCISAMTI